MNPGAETTNGSGRPLPMVLALCLYVAAFLTGGIVMSFEMLGSRYLGPYFGNGIYTWAALISTVLAALCVGYFVGGMLADRRPSPRVLGVTVAAGSVPFISCCCRPLPTRYCNSSCSRSTTSGSAASPRR
jgi:hypothetical protein